MPHRFPAGDSGICPFLSPETTRTPLPPASSEPWGSPSECGSRGVSPGCHLLSGKCSLLQARECLLVQEPEVTMLSITFFIGKEALNL